MGNNWHFDSFSVLLICTARVSGLRLIDVSFGQCVYVSFETNIKTTFCQSIQVAGELCLWPSWMQGVLIKDGVTDHRTETQGSSMSNTLGGVR